MIAWNRAIADLTGVPPDDMVGVGDYGYAVPFYGIKRPLLVDLLSADDGEILRLGYTGIRRERGNLMAETAIKDPDGREKTLWVHAAPLAGAGGEPSGAIETIRDVTGYRSDEIVNMESEVRLREFTDLLPVMYFELDLSGRIRYANPVAFGVFGYTREEYERGVTIFDLLAPEEFAKATSNINRIFSGEKIGGIEYALVRHDGNRITTIIHPALIPGLPGRGPAGIRGLAIDNSERRRAAETLELMNRKLNLLSNVTRHDVLNQLTGLIAYLDLSRELAADPTQASYLDRGYAAADTIRKQIVFTREYQDIGIASPGWQDIAETVQRACSFVPLPRDRSRIFLDDTLAGVSVYADPLLEKVFFNLIENALRHAGCSEPEVRISLQRKGSGIAIVCEDNGSGIAFEDKERIFERGFGKKSGYGLFFVREVLSITGLSVFENGTPGRGARFEIWIPREGFRTAEPEKLLDPLAC